MKKRNNSPVSFEFKLSEKDSRTPKTVPFKPLSFSGLNIPLDPSQVKTPSSNGNNSLRGDFRTMSLPALGSRKSKQKNLQQFSPFSLGGKSKSLLTDNFLLRRIPERVSIYSGYEVRFNKYRRNYYRSPHLRLTDKHIGRYLIVEGDRGFDIGRLEKCYSEEEFVRVTRNKPKTGRNSVKNILRMASQEEVGQLEAKYKDERSALRLAQQKCREMKMKMELVDAEYQFDRQKLIFYFKSTSRVDFREFVRELFKMFKVRIWLKHT